MPIAIVSPKELRNFANHLERTAQSIARSKSKTERLVKEARSVWKDAKYDRFRKVFDDTVRDLDHFTRLTDDYARFLERKSSLAQKFLDR